MNEPWLIVTGDFTVTGGMDKANYHLAWHLADERNAEVHLVAHHVDSHLAGHLNVCVHPVRRPFGRHALGARMLDREGVRVARALTSRCPDARVIVNGTNCRWPGINWVHMVHSACPWSDAGAPWSFRARHRLCRLRNCRHERRWLTRCPLLLANSQKTRDDLIRTVGVDGERVHVVYLGCEPTKFSPVSQAQRTAARNTLKLDNDERVLLFVGALGHDRRKGLDTLLLACQQLSDVGVPFKLLVVGAGALDSWRARVDASGLCGLVTLLGHRTDVPLLTAAADLLVSPARHEPYGLNVHEALCREVPAIVTRAAGVAERYPPELADLLVPADVSGDFLARRILDCLHKRDALRKPLAELGARLRAETWSDVAERICGLIDEHIQPPNDGMSETRTGFISQAAGTTWVPHI